MKISLSMSGRLTLGAEGASRFFGAGKSGAPVMQTGRLVGIVSERDLLHSVML